MGTASRHAATERDTWADRYRLFYHPDFNRRHRIFTDSVFLLGVITEVLWASIKKESRAVTAGRELHPAPKRFLWVLAAKITDFCSLHLFEMLKILKKDIPATACWQRAGTVYSISSIL
jgi:hypothetical protein